MAGVHLRVVPLRRIDFSHVASGQTEEMVLAEGIDVSQGREVCLVVRTHSNLISASSGGSSTVGEIDVYAYLDGRTPEDPGVLFATTSLLGITQIIAGASVPGYLVSDLGTPTGALIKVLARGTRVDSFGANTIAADISVDVTVKSA